MECDVAVVTVATSQVDSETERKTSRVCETQMPPDMVLRMQQFSFCRWLKWKALSLSPQRTEQKKSLCILLCRCTCSKKTKMSIM